VGFFTKFFGRTASEGAAFALGTAVGPALTPAVRELINEAWKVYPVRPPDVMALAAGVAQGQVTDAAARAWARENGFGDKQFDALIDIANVGPGVASAFTLWRRGKTDEAGFKRAIKRLGLEQEWINGLVTLKDERLDPAVIAVAVQRGLIHNAGILPVGPPTGTGKVPPMPMVDIDPFNEAEAAGIDPDRIKVLARIVGLPASPDLAARMLFRGIIEAEDFDRAISEGNTRNEWAPFLLQGFRDIPSTLDYVEGRLRGWLNDAEMHAGGAKHGMRAADVDLLFKIHGRPLSWHQTWIGLQRGGVYDGPIDAIHPAFLHSLRQSNIRPEWYNLAWHSRYTYPSAFVMRALVQDGTLTRDEGEADLIDMGWRPDRAKQVSTKWAQGTGAGGDPNVSKAETHLWTTLHNSFKNDESDAAQVEAGLDLIGVPQAAHARILNLWEHERELHRRQLTPTQVKKAWTKAVPNPATGAPWTRDDALARLEQMGYSTADAETFLGE
jgi:hypothetical protein